MIALIPWTGRDKQGGSSVDAKLLVAAVGTTQEGHCLFVVNLLLPALFLLFSRHALLQKLEGLRGRFT